MTLGLVLAAPAAVALGLAPLACDPPAAAAPDSRQAILTALTEQVILPAYAELTAQTAALSAAAQGLCAPSASVDLAAARAAWWAARGAFAAVSIFKLGPHVDFPARLGVTLDFWPARPAAIEAVLADDAPLDAAGLAGLGAAARGLPVVEYLLYGPGAEAAAFAADARRCAYLVAASADAAHLAAALETAWRPEGGGFAYELLDPAGRGLSLTSTQEALSELANRMLFALDDMRRDKLGTPLETGDAEATESRFSGRATQDLRDVLAMVGRVFHGAEGSLGFASDGRLAARPDVIARFDSARAAAEAALAAVPEPLGAAVQTAPAQVEAAIEALRAVQVVLQTDVTALLGLTRTFNDADGD